MPDHPYRLTKFLLSAPNADHFPADTGREVAFVGRSNVGKSSVINTITDHKNLARTSKTPGRTRLINFFTVDEGVRLVDLPGYGFARVPQAIKKQWSAVINGYLNHRVSLVGLVMIIDVRRELSAEDMTLLDWCMASGIPVHLLVNKADKLPFGRRKQALLKYQRQFEEAAVSVQLYSAMDKTGVEAARGLLDSWLFGKKSGPRQ